MKEFFRYEVTLDLSRSSKEEADKVLVALARNGYEVYFSYESFENIKQEVCFSAEQDQVRKVEEK